MSNAQPDMVSPIYSGFMDADERLLLKKLGFNGLYFMRHEDDVSGAPTKIGASNAPFNRIIDLQIGSWRKCYFHEVLCIKQGKSTVTLADLVDGPVEGVRRSEGKKSRLFGRMVRTHWIQPTYFTPADMERLVHQRLKERGHWRTGEWFHGDADALVSAARDVIMKAKPNAAVFTAVEAKNFIAHLRDEALAEMVSRAA